MAFLTSVQALRGTPQPRLLIEVGLQDMAAAQQRPWIRFSDNGPGIAPEVLAKLTREPVTTKGQAGGNGMGLMFCQRVMQSLGGSVEIQSTLGEGAAFSLYFRPHGEAGPAA